MIVKKIFFFSVYPPSFGHQFVIPGSASTQSKRQMQFSTQTKIYGSAAALVHPAVRMLQDAEVAIKEGPAILERA